MWKVSDLGDTEPQFFQHESDEIINELTPRESIINKAAETLTACRSLYKLTVEALEQGMNPLIIGGDHSLSIGSVAAVSDFYAKQDLPIGLDLD